MTKLYYFNFKTLCSILAILLIVLLASFPTKAQGILDRPVTIHYDHKRLADVLTEISRQGQFYFSYDGKLLPKDSVLTLSVVSKKVSEVLRQLFQDRYAYEERKNYLIITPHLRGFTLINTDITDENNSYSVSGLVADERTGERLMNASVYEKQQLISTLTDEHGYFRLKLKGGSHELIRITVSKLRYRDTTVNFLQAVPVSSRANTQEYRNARHRSNRIERNGLGSLFITARQKIQSVNITDFFAKRPFQVSITPGLSTHGMFSPQVVNKFSLNLAGGYTAGVNGLEVGGLFNINKEDSKYLQLAGIFNLVGGNMTGLQLAGIHNRSLDTVRGLQLSLFSNKAENELSGVQLSALHNETRYLKGLQIGLVNIADTSKGVSIGLLNVIRNGFYQVAYTVNDLANTNMALKTGTHTFYSALLLSYNIDPHNKLGAFGLGIGHDFMFNERLYLSAEANNYIVNTGLWENWWFQGKLLLNVPLTSHISLRGGLTYNHFFQSGDWQIPGYKNIIGTPEFNQGFLPDAWPYYNGPHTKNWVGWEAGIAFTSAFKRAKRVIDNSNAWYIGAAVTQGHGWTEVAGPFSGIELFVHRDLGERLTGTISTGYTYVGAQKNYRVGQIGGDYYYLAPQKLVPIKAGIRLKLGPTFYITGEMGDAFGTDNVYVSKNSDGSDLASFSGSFNSFMYAAGLGFSFRNGFETGLKFEDYNFGSDLKQFALRLGYRFKISK